MTRRCVIVLFLLASVVAAPAAWNWWADALKGQQRAAASGAPANWYAQYQSTALAIYPMEETTGTNVDDVSVANLDAAAYAHSTPGGTNGWLFDGTDDYIACPTNMGISGRSSITVALWFDCDRIAVNDGLFGAYTGFFGQQSVVGAAGGALFYVGNGNTYVSYEDAAAGYSNGWRCMVFVYDGSLSGSARAAVYYDATNRAVSMTGTIPAAIPAGTYGNWRIGAITGLSRWWKGRIMRVVVDPSAWSAASVTNYYQTTRPGVNQ